jgi:hypothetical protein
MEPITEDKMAVVIAAGSDLLAPGPVSLKQVAGLPLVLPSSRHGLRTLLVQSLHRAGLALQPRIEVDRAHHLPCPAARQGLPRGGSRFPRRAAPRLRRCAAAGPSARFQRIL